MRPRAEDVRTKEAHMPSRVPRRRWLVSIVVTALVATGGIAYATIPDAGGVVHTCYTKSSGAWRVIDTDLGQTCKSNEAALDLYSKSGADLAFLAKTGKAADSDKLDGKDSTEFLGSSAKAADSDKLDGRDSFRYLKGFDAWLVTDLTHLGDGVTTDVGHQAEGSYPGMSLALTCDTDGGTTLVASSPDPFFWWWDDTFGQTPAGAPPYQQSFQIGNGVENHAFRSVLAHAWDTTTLDLDTSIGFNPQFEADVCTVAWTLHKTLNVSPGP
jgi:hypothetical protein